MSRSVFVSGVCAAHVSHSTVFIENRADANQVHDWRISADFAQVLIGKARRLYADEALAVLLEQTVYTLDSTTIDLCVTAFQVPHTFRRWRPAAALTKTLGTLHRPHRNVPSTRWLASTKNTWPWPGGGGVGCRLQFALDERRLVGEDFLPLFWGGAGIARIRRYSRPSRCQWSRT